MVRFLQISDIHFRRLPDARDEYAQLKARLFEKVREICTTSKVDCILICGDVAFSGNTEEYEQRAKVFINNLLEITQCQTAQVYMVPGNHDKDRNAKYQNTRWMFRECMLNAEKIDNHFFDLYKEENDVYSKCLMPFDAYYNFANNYRCVPEAVANTRNGQPRTYLDRLNWTDDLKVGQYTLRLHGINTCYVSDKEDENHNPTGKRVTTNDYGSADYYYVNKSSLPKVYGGFNTSLSWKGFDLSAIFAYSIGGYIYNRDITMILHNGSLEGRDWSTEILKRWTPDNRNTDVPALSTTTNNWNSASTRFLQNNSYMRLKNLTLSYNLPKQWISKLSLSSVQVYVQGDNLFTIHRNQGLDPEQGITGITYYRYPAMRTISGGINVSF